MYWYRHPEGNGNFGDELSPYLISRLTGLNLKYINVNLLGKSRWLAFKDLSYRLKVRNINLRCYLEYLVYIIIKPRVLLGIGSLLQSWTYDKAIVWGSGVLTSKGMLPEANYLAVRGLHTVSRLREQGHRVSETIGDPAILLPRIFPVQKGPKHRIGVVLHYFHQNRLKDKFHDDILIISLLDSIETILNQINDCELVISTSLHGVIVSHTYGVKAIWAKYLKDDLNKGDDIKFYDYFSSVKIEPYQPIDITGLYGKCPETIFDEVHNGFAKSLVPSREVISKIQDGLIGSFPFKIIAPVSKNNPNGNTLP